MLEGKKDLKNIPVAITSPIRNQELIQPAKMK